MNLRIVSVILWLASAVALSMGFYKMFAYENFESPLLDNTNVYVGGDAYNYIINGNYATGYFVLFGSLLVAGFMCEILLAMRKSSLKKEGASEVNSKEVSK